jgi:hypothetical protein
MNLNREEKTRRPSEEKLGLKVDKTVAVGAVVQMCIMGKLH